MPLTSTNPPVVVLFDMDGLLIDSERLAYRAYMEVGVQYGFQFNPRVQMDLSGRTEQAILDRMGELWGPQADVVTWRKAIVARKKAQLEEAQGKVGVRPGARELLAWLRDRSIPAALASSSARPLIDTYLQAEGLVDAFDVIVDGTQVTHGKPDPEIFVRAAEELGYRDASVVVLEDSRAGVLAANAAGFISTFIYDDLSHLGTLTEGMPVLIDLPGPESVREIAQHSVDSLADVPQLLHTLNLV